MNPADLDLFALLKRTCSPCLPGHPMTALEGFSLRGPSAQVSVAAGSAPF